MSTGFVLNIPQEMLNRLEDADKKIEKLARTSEDAQTRIVSAFKSINTHGIDAFINKLTEAQNAIQGLSNVELNIKSGGFEGVKRGVAEVSNELRKLNELQEQHRQKSEEIVAAEKREEEFMANKARLQKEYFEAKRKYEAESAKLDAMPLPWGGESFEDTIKRYEQALKRVQKAAQEIFDPEESEGLRREIEFRREELKILKSIRAEEDAIEKTKQRYRNQKQTIVEPLNQSYEQAEAALDTLESSQKAEKGLYRLRGELHEIEKQIEKAEAAYGRSVILGGKQQGVVQTPVAAVAEQSTVAIDAINKLIAAINKLYASTLNNKGENKTKIIDPEEDIKRIAELKREIKEINDTLRKGGEDGTPIGMAEQQALVDKREALKQELKLQEESTQKRIQRESDADEEVYENWLRQKDRERRENEKIEDEKFKAQQKAAMAAFKAEQERLDKLAQIRRQNEGARTSGEEAKWGYERTISMYAQMFDEIERNRKESLDRQNANEFAEYQSLLARIKQLKKEKEEATGFLAVYEDATEEELRLSDAASRLYGASEEELEKSLHRKEELERKHGEKLEQIRRQNYAQDFREMRQLEEKKRKEYEETVQRERNTYRGAMNFSASATSVVEMTQAIRHLESARDSLSNTDAQYTQKVKTLNDEIKRQSAEINKVRNGAKELQKEHRNLMDISGQLARRLALVLSVSQITGYVKKLIEVRGEFELQQRSLQAILQNKDEANRIWQQTVDLAVKSPFRVKELVSYTKQLAAYRIESDKLFETNKMLADISAGLGVDMQRLILAFGQVRSAAYLRGTELRQFTEAGIPILEQLAQYFTELEGRAVSVGDVFERVSKRMVSFADVEEIFKRMTSEGGTFYRMQEIQAETLQGQISNLKDSVDIMLNEIGKAHQDTLKSSVAFVRSIVQNWRLLATAIQQAGFALAGFSAVKIIRALRLTGDALVDATVKTKGLTAATAKLKLAMMDLGKWVKANPYLLAAGLVVSAAHALVQYGKSVDAMNEKYDEMSQRELRRVDTLKQLNEQVEKNNQAIKDAIAEQDNASEGTDEYATAEENLSRARGKNISLLERLKKEYPEVYASITKQEDGTVDLTKAIEEQNRVAQRQIALQQQAKGGLFQQDFSTNYEDAVEAFGKYQAALEDVRAQAYVTHQDLQNALNVGDISQESFDSIVGFIDQLKSAKDLTSVREILKQINATIGGSDELSFKFVSNIQKATQGLSDAFVDYSVSLKNFRANILPMTSTIGNEVRERLLDPERGAESAKEYIDGVLDQFGVLNKEVRLWARDEIVKIINVDLVWGEGSSGGGDEELDGWAKRVKEAVDALNDEIKKKSPKIDARDLFPVPNKNQTKEEYLAVAKDAIGVAEMTYDELQKIEDQEVVDRTKALSPFVETFRKILNLYKETEKGGDDKDTFTPMLRTVKEIYQEFKKLQGSFDDLTAKEGALAKFGDAFKEAFGKTPEQMGFDLFSEEGVKAAYDYLISKAPDAKKKIQAELAKGEVVWDVKLQEKKGTDKELLDNVQQLFDRYDLSLELKKLNIPPDLAKSLFDVDYLDLKGLKENVINEFSGTSEALKTELQKGFGNIDWLTVKNLSSGELMEAIKKALKDIDDLEEKQQLESAKRFAKFLTQNLDQTKVVLQQRGIDIAFAKKEFDEGRISAEQFAETVKNIVAQSNEEISKFNLDKFKESSEYIQAMGDLSAYSKKEIQSLIKTLNDAVTKNAHLFDADEVKSYIDTLTKAQEELESRDVFKWGDFEIAADIIQTQKEIEDKKADIETNKAELETQKQKLAELQAKLDNLKAQQKATQDAGGDTAQVDADIAKTTSDIVTANEEIGKTNNEIKTNTGLLGSLGDKMKGIAGNMGSTLAIVDAIVHGINDTVQGVNEIYKEVGSVMESFGKETDFSTDFGKGAMAMETFAKSSQAATDAWDALKNGDPMGVMVNVTKSITEIIKGINAMHDEGFEVTVQYHLERVEELQKKYEKLEWVIERAFSFEKYGMVAKQITNLEGQINNLNSAIMAEEDKKDLDEERIKELQENIEEATRQIQELYDNLRADIVGTFQDLSDTLGNAMVSALQQGEDAIAAWGKEVDTIIQDIVSKLVIQKFLEPKIADLIDDYYSQIMPANAAAEKKYKEWQDAYNSGQGVKANELYREYLQLVEESIGEVPKISQDATEALQQGLNETGEWFMNVIPDWLKNMIQESGTGLTGLQKGIQGITEDQADILAAYWNSVRGYTASIDAKMDLILANMGVGAENNPMLEQMRLVAKNTSAINTLLNSLVKGGHPQGGQGLKVFMD